jgi:ribosomal protein L7/L12
MCSVGMGLKEAKDIWDQSRDRVVAFEVEDPLHRLALVRQLKDLGMEVL